MEVITGDVGRRTWSPEEKARILAEAAIPGVVVSEMARRHGLQPWQVFDWRREARAAFSTSSTAARTKPITGLNSRACKTPKSCPTRRRRSPAHPAPSAGWRGRPR
ncbi:transposase [Azospirillum palustre]